MTVRLVTIAKFATPIEAEMAKDELEDAGIQAVIENVNSGGLFAVSGISEIRVVVREADASRAKEILERGEG